MTREPAEDLSAKTLLIMDAHCALCSWGARLVARRDLGDLFCILPAQTERGRRLLAQHGLAPDDPESWLVLAPGGAALTGGAAAIWVARRLSGPWPWLAFVAGLAPSALREPVYRWIARNRYRLFGRADLCRAPNERLRRKLLTE